MLRHVAMFKWKEGITDEQKVAARDSLHSSSERRIDNANSNRFRQTSGTTVTTRERFSRNTGNRIETNLRRVCSWEFISACCELRTTQA